MATTQFTRRWYTTREVAQILGFSTTKVKMLIAQRDLRSVKVGGSRRILPEWVDEFIETVTQRDSA